MAYYYDNLKLDKGMYQEAGRSFSQVLESLDPSERYKGTSLEGLDAFQRQLKRFDIKVKGAGSDVVEKFFRTSDAAVLFPEYISRTVRQGMEEGDILPQITAAVTTGPAIGPRPTSSNPATNSAPLCQSVCSQVSICFKRSISADSSLAKAALSISPPPCPTSCQASAGKSPTCIYNLAHISSKVKLPILPLRNSASNSRAVSSKRTTPPAANSPLARPIASRTISGG